MDFDNGADPDFVRILEVALGVDCGRWCFAEALI